MLAGPAMSSRLHGVIVLASGKHRDCRNSQLSAKETIRCVPGRGPCMHRPHENSVDGLGAVQRPLCTLEAATTPFTMLTATRPISIPNFGQPNQTNSEAQAGTKEVVSMLSAPRVMLPHLQQQQPQQGQQGQPGQQQQHAIPPPPPPVQVTNPQDLSLAGVLHFLQTEWRRYERERNEWEIERAEMRVCLQKPPSRSNDTLSRRELPSSRESDAPSKM